MFTSQSKPLADAIKSFNPAPTAYSFQPCDHGNFLYYQITKCGCTFVRTLINKMDGYPDNALPLKVMWENDGAVAFVIVRNPFDRFLSLYFDKIFQSGSQIAKVFNKRGLVNNDAKTAVEHGENCMAALSWIEQTIQRGVLNDMNPHWRPQIYRLHKISKLNVTMLTLDGLNWQMPHLLSDQIPDIARRMQDCGRQNVSKKPIDPASLATDELRQRISGIYAADEAIYADVNRHWAQIKSG